MAADEGFFFLGGGRCGAAHLPGTEGKTELQVEKKPIKAGNKNDKRLFIKQETEKVNIYHFGFYLVDLENRSAFVARLSDCWKSLR